MLKEKVNTKIQKNNNGITLIALIITIIVMLILTAVVLMIALGDNGIITKAKEASEAQKIAEIEERIQMYIVDCYDEFLVNTGTLLKEETNTDDFAEWMIVLTGCINMGNLEEKLQTEFSEEIERGEIEVTGFYDSRLPSEIDAPEELMTLSYEEAYNEYSTIWGEYERGELQGSSDNSNQENAAIVGRFLYMLYERLMIDNYKIKVVYHDKMVVIDSEGKTSKDDNSDEMDFIYEEIDDETCRVVRYIGKKSNVVIPETLNNLTVTAIGDGENPIFSSFEALNIRTGTGIEDLENNWQQAETLLKEGRNDSYNIDF